MLELRLSTLLAGGLLTACTHSASPISAKLIDQNNGTYMLTVKAAAVDARYVKEKQVYLNMVLLECTGEKKGYPVEPYVDSQAVSSFSFDVSGATTTFSGSVPELIVLKLTKPCVRLEGGGYLGSKFRSNMVAVDGAMALSEQTHRPLSEAD